MTSIKQEILRYLGHKNQHVPQALDKMINECLDMMQQAIVSRQVHLNVPLLHDVEGITVEGTGIFLNGHATVNYLRGCESVTIMAATLSTAADALIQKWQDIDLTRALILDACATGLIESFCDETEQTIRQKAAEQGLGAIARISPGYGDFPLEAQPQILQTLNAAKRIGLTCTPHHLMLPRKSVTAIIGLGSRLAPQTKNCQNEYKCNSCSMRQTCPFTTIKTTEEPHQ